MVGAARAKRSFAFARSAAKCPGKRPQKPARTKFDRKSEKQNRITSDEISDEERRHRNFLGLKLKGSVNKEELERLYKQRLAHYSDNKLAEMSSSKRKASLEKKEKTEQAYEFLRERLSKDT